MRIAGATASDIAAQLRLSPKTIWRYISERVTEISEMEHSPDLRREHWHISIERLEAIYRHHYPLSEAGNAQSAAICLRAIEQVARLCGLEGAPAETKIPDSQIVERAKKIISPMLNAHIGALLDRHHSQPQDSQ